MHAQPGVLDQARLDGVGANKDSEQARIGWCLVLGILDQHAQFATNTLQAYGHGQCQEITGCVRRRLMLHRQINQPGQQLGKPGSRERDVDAIGSDFHAAEQGHKHRIDCIRCASSGAFRELTATLNLLAAC